PSADADVDMLALREDPRVPTGNRAELDHCPPPPAVLARVNIRDIPFEGDSVTAIPEAERPRGQPVDAVRADDGLRLRSGPGETHGAVALDGSRPQAVAELGARFGRLLAHERVDPPPLRHHAARPLTAPL